MMGVIFHNSTFERNPKYHFGKCKLLERIKLEFSKNRQGPLVGHLRQFAGIIPLEFKKKDWLKFEKELLDIPPIDSCYNISERLRQKYYQNQQLFAQNG